jgi:hypothetical protein
MTFIYNFIGFFFTLPLFFEKDLDLKLVEFSYYNWFRVKPKPILSISFKYSYNFCCFKRKLVHFSTMTEVYLSSSSTDEENNDFFDNIPENEKDLTGLFAEVAINKAKELLISDLNSTDDDSENTDWETNTVSSIASGSTEAGDEIELPQTNSSNLTLCALVDIKNGLIQRCGETKDLRGLAQLIGTWQIDNDAVCEARKDLGNLGVCQSHFMFDQNRLHEKGAKQEQNIEHSFLHRRHCLFCGLNINFFSRGKFCHKHSVSIGNKNLLIPCIGYKSCHALQINEPIVAAAKLQQKSRYVCCNYFEKHGGHLYVKPGKGKSVLQCKTQGNHREDTKKSLQLISSWITDLANSNDDLLKTKALAHFTGVIEHLFNFTSSSNENDTYSPTPIVLTPLDETPSFFFINSFFKLHRINLRNYYFDFQEDFQKIGLQIGLDLLKNRKQILQKKQELEEPNSLGEYRSALPLKLYGLLDSIIRVLFEKKRQYANRKKKYRPISNSKQINDDNNFCWI